MPQALQALIDNLELETIDDDHFRGTSIDDNLLRVYGGQVIGQSIAAAQRTLSPTYACHSLHSYFLRAGDPNQPITYRVNRSRDGRSFATRHVQAIQNDQPICHSMMSFQCAEDGFEHQAAMPQDVPLPDSLPRSFGFALDMMHKHLKLDANGHQTWPIDHRYVEPTLTVNRQAQQPYSLLWVKTDGSLGDDPTLHKEVFTYASDALILETACRPHPELAQENNLFMASIDHAIWFHRPFRADQWMLFELESNSASGGRGLARANVFQDGQLIATVSQEGVMRAQPG